MQAPSESDSKFSDWRNWPGAVLLSDEIERYCNSSPPLNDPFNPKNLKPARYQLTLGQEAILGGHTISVNDNRPLAIPPHQVAIVRTHEILNLPRFLIARWNLTVDKVYEGLLWVGALQVDPGWTSYLPCPLYNLSDHEVAIRFREKLFTIDFVRTTPFNDKAEPYKMPFEEHPPLNFYSIGLRSGPHESLNELREVKQEVSTIRGQGYLLLTIVGAALAALISGLTVVAVRPSVEPGGSLLSFWPLTALVGAGVATVLSAISLVVSLKGRSQPR